MQSRTGQLNKIVCAVDFSEGAHHAFRVAAKLAAAQRAELVITHVWTPPVYFVGEAVGMPASVLTERVLAIPPRA